MKKISLILSIVLITVLLSACGAGGKNKIVGRWDSDEYIKGYAESYSFYENGTYDKYKISEKTKKRGNSTSGHGTWTITENGGLRINDYAVGVTVFEYEVNGNMLMLDGDEFSKVK